MRSVKYEERRKLCLSQIFKTEILMDLRVPFHGWVPCDPKITFLVIDLSVCQLSALLKNKL